jgi:hypothetical protein
VVKRSVDGDLDRVFDEYVAARGPQLRRTAYLVVRDWHTADDVVQSALVKVYLAWPRLSPERLLTIATGQELRFPSAPTGAGGCGWVVPERADNIGCGS